MATSEAPNNGRTEIQALGWCKCQPDHFSKYFTVDIPRAPACRTNATFQRDIGIRRLVQQRKLDTKSRLLLWVNKMYRTARMSTWKASEAVIDDMTIRLVTYCYGGEAKSRIDRSRVWVATINEIWAEQINASRIRYNLRVSGPYLDADAPR